jgi:predicted secreted hydrolase
VAFEITLGNRRFEIAPLMADQEVDARASTGGFYWEGAVSLMESGTLIGRGYLELTGYAQPLQL